jgi:hypothetical protein
VSQSVKHTHFVVFQLRFWSFAIWAAGAHQTRATLTFQLDNNRADVNALRASHDNSTADLIEVCEGYISGLVKDDGGLHRHAGRPWRRDRRVRAILLHVNEPLAMRCCFQLCGCRSKTPSESRTLRLAASAEIRGGNEEGRIASLAVEKKPLGVELRFGLNLLPMTNPLQRLGGGVRDDIWDKQTSSITTSYSRCATVVVCNPQARQLYDLSSC